MAKEVSMEEIKQVLDELEEETKDWIRANASNDMETLPNQINGTLRAAKKAVKEDDMDEVQKHLEQLSGMLIVQMAINKLQEAENNKEGR